MSDPYEPLELSIMFASSAKAGPTLEYNVAAHRGANTSFFVRCVGDEEKVCQRASLGHPAPDHGRVCEHGLLVGHLHLDL